jgi:hypothetical protein
MITRRELLQITAIASAWLSSRSLHAADNKMTIHTRPIPKSPKGSEVLPVVGLGTWQTFDVGTGKTERDAVAQVLEKYLASGARVIDSSPMYGRAEEVTGDELATIGAIGKPFLATKVWTSGKQEGIAQMQRSMKRMRAKVMDLMQVHNLVDYKTHLPVLREWKEAGTIRYLGVTHYQHDQFDTIEKLMREEKPRLHSDPLQHRRSRRGEAHFAGRRGHGDRGARDAAVRDRRSVSQGQGQAAAAARRRSRLHELGSVLPEVPDRPSSGHLPDPRDEQSQARARQCRGRFRAIT